MRLCFAHWSQRDATTRKRPRGNWMVKFGAKSLLPIIGIHNVRSCEPTHSRLTLPAALPDGLLDIVHTDGTKSNILMELESHPSPAHIEQLIRDMEVARLALKRLPETVLVLLCWRGQAEQISEYVEISPLGWSVTRHSWKVVKMWEIPAQQILDSNDVGQIPLLPLAKSDLSPTNIVQICKERIERQAPPKEQSTLLTVTAIMAGARYLNSDHWIRLLGGKRMLTDTPVFQHWKEENVREARQDAIVKFLTVRFKSVPEELATLIRSELDHQRLDRGIEIAADCKSLKSFKIRFSKK